MPPVHVRMPLPVRDRCAPSVRIDSVRTCGSRNLGALLGVISHNHISGPRRRPRPVGILFVSPWRRTTHFPVARPLGLRAVSPSREREMERLKGFEPELGSPVRTHFELFRRLPGCDAGRDASTIIALRMPARMKAIIIYARQHHGPKRGNASGNWTTMREDRAGMCSPPTRTL
jgi:hypothetical protein